MGITSLVSFNLMYDVVCVVEWVVLSTSALGPTLAIILFQRFKPCLTYHIQYSNLMIFASDLIQS